MSGFAAHSPGQRRPLPQPDLRHPQLRARRPIRRSKEPTPGELDRAIDSARADRGGRKLSKRLFRHAPEGLAVDGVERARETVDEFFLVGHGRAPPWLELTWRAHPFEVRRYSNPT